MKNQPMANKSNPDPNNQPVKKVNTPGNNNIQVKNQKNSKGVVVQEEEIKPPPPKIKNLERYIHITTYNDSETMKTLKELFESLNKDAFKLKSVKEIYTKTLTPEEQSDNDIDYISGFQILDSSIRITVLEGKSGKAMKLAKESLPKINLNSATKKVFSDSKILFDTRLYSKFNLWILI